MREVSGSPHGVESGTTSLSGARQQKDSTGPFSHILCQWIQSKWASIVINLKVVKTDFK